MTHEFKIKVPACEYLSSGLKSKAVSIKLHCSYMHYVGATSPKTEISVKSSSVHCSSIFCLYPI